MPIRAELMQELTFKVRRLILIRTQTIISTEKALRSSRFWRVRYKRQRLLSSSGPRSSKLRANSSLERSFHENTAEPARQIAEAADQLGGFRTITHLWQRRRCRLSRTRNGPATAA